MSHHKITIKTKSWFDYDVEYDVSGVGTCDAVERQLIERAFFALIDAFRVSGFNKRNIPEIGELWGEQCLQSKTD